METVATDGKVMGPEEGALLERLWRSLVRWLQRRRAIRCMATAMDIASEVVRRAYRRLFFDWRPAAPRIAWSDLWNWARSVAKTVLADRGRAAGRERKDGLVDVETLTGAPAAPDDDWKRCQVEALVEKLLPVLAPPEQATLRMLLAGVEANDEIARLRGVTLRAVQKSRRRLEVIASDAWKECRAVRS